jgi:hypothetical protein
MLPNRGSTYIFFTPEIAISYIFQRFEPLQLDQIND